MLPLFSATMPLGDLPIREAVMTLGIGIICFNVLIFMLAENTLMYFHVKPQQRYA